MIDQPSLSKEAIRAAVLASHHLSLTELEFLPLGADGQAWVYRAVANDGTRTFVKLRTGKVKEAGLLIPHYLQQQGIAHIVAPIPTVDQTLWQQVDEFALVLYPYVEGHTGLERGLSPVQWQEIGASLRQIHATKIPSSLAEELTCETFIPDWMDSLQRRIVTIHTQVDRDPIAAELANFWQKKASVIEQLVARAEELGWQVCKRSLLQFLCHADIHAANLLIDPHNQLWIVDWDQTMLAPKERDLMFVIGGGVLGPSRPEEEAAFLLGYGAKRSINRRWPIIVMPGRCKTLGPLPKTSLPDRN
ncbi:MAG: aminoglycoside phosphotransferase family protein [Caldilineaceae bacterium]